jgi:hypothetical protein
MYAIVAFLDSNDEPIGGLSFHDFDDAEAQIITWMLNDNEANLAGHFYYRFVNLAKPLSAPIKASPMENFGRALAGMGMAENEL